MRPLPSIKSCAVHIPSGMSGRTWGRDRRALDEWPREEGCVDRTEEPYWDPERVSENFRARREIPLRQPGYLLATRILLMCIGATNCYILVGWGLALAFAFFYVLLIVLVTYYERNQ